MNEDTTRHGASLDALLAHTNAFTNWRAVEAAKALDRLRMAHLVAERKAVEYRLALFATIERALLGKTPNADSVTQADHAQRGINRRYRLRRLFAAKLESAYRRAYQELWARLAMEA